MEVHFPPELEAKLARSATRQGRNPDEILQDLLTRYFDEESGSEPSGEREPENATHGRSGAALIEAMQASPYPDIDLHPTRERLPVRDAVL